MRYGKRYGSENPQLHMKNGEVMTLTAVTFCSGILKTSQQCLPEIALSQRYRVKVLTLLDITHVLSE